MEFSLHKQLKELYSDDASQREMRLGRFRIDIIRDGRLVEIQQSSLSSIRNKIRTLLGKHQVDIVKPVVARKKIVRLDRKDGDIVSVRLSPTKKTLVNIFDELLYFTQVFPHPNLRIIAPLIEIQEVRFPGHGRRRRWGKSDFVIADRLLESVVETREFCQSQDLCDLLPDELPKRFDTEVLSQLLGVSRGDGQRIAYVLRQTGAAKQVGKAGNRWVYQLQRKRKPSRKSASG
ncbi:MAG: hypothetical protein ABL888_01700 [Pirellulaceae bacterium]